jgi:hypothetical protein
MQRRVNAPHGVTRTGSPTGALPASTAPHRYRPPRPKAMTSPSDIVSTEVATGCNATNHDDEVTKQSGLSSAILAVA